MLSAPEPYLVEIDVSTTHVVTPAWVREQVGNWDDGIDDVVRSYLDGVDDGDLSLPKSVERRTLEFDVFCRCGKCE